MMKQYGHISAMQPPALTADSGHRYHATGAAIIACVKIRAEIPLKTYECVILVQSHSVATRVEILFGK